MTKRREKHQKDPSFAPLFAMLQIQNNGADHVLHPYPMTYFRHFTIGIENSSNYDRNIYFLVNELFCVLLQPNSDNTIHRHIKETLCSSCRVKA